MSNCLEWSQGAPPMKGMMPSVKDVLIVDDDYDIREMLTEILTNNGYSVVSAVDREEALTVLAKYPIHTVLLDYMMPGLSATKFLDAVASDYPDAKIVLMTAGDSVGAVADVLGLSEYLGKPFEEARLLKILRPDQQTTAQSSA